MKTTKLFFAAIAMLSASSLIAQTNYIPNGGFEELTWIDGTQPQEWPSTNGNNETQSWDVAAINGVTPAEGSRMYYIECLKATTYAWQTLNKVNGSVKLKNGGKYILKFKAYSVLGSGQSANPTIRIFAEMREFGWPVSINKTTIIPVVPGAWRSFSIPFTFNDAAAPKDQLIVLGLNVYLQGNAAGTIFYLDDFIINDDNSTGIEESKVSTVAFFPNPVVDRCKVMNGNFKSAKVLNLAGMTVSEQLINANNEIDLSSLTAGCYIVKLNGATQATFKVVKN